MTKTKGKKNSSYQWNDEVKDLARKAGKYMNKQESKKCESDELEYLSYPVQRRCKNCGQFWSGEPPECKYVEFNTVFPEQPTDWEKEFMDFWYEKGKYMGRLRGYTQYKFFIKSLLDSRDKELIEKIEKLGDDPARESNERRRGYYQALDDIINLIRK